MEDPSTTVDETVREGNIRQNDKTKILPGKYGEPKRPFNDEKARIINKKQERRNRWVEYLEKHASLSNQEDLGSKKCLWTGNKNTSSRQQKNEI